MCDETSQSYFKRSTEYIKYTLCHFADCVVPYITLLGAESINAKDYPVFCIFVRHHGIPVICFSMNVAK